MTFYYVLLSHLQSSFFPVLQPAESVLWSLPQTSLANLAWWHTYHGNIYLTSTLSYTNAQ